MKNTLAFLLLSVCSLVADYDASTLPTLAAPLQLYNLTALAPYAASSPIIDRMEDSLWISVPSYVVDYVMTDDKNLDYGRSGGLVGYQTQWKAVWNVEGITVLIRHKVQETPYGVSQCASPEWKTTQDGPMTSSQKATRTSPWFSTCATTLLPTASWHFIY